MGFDPPKPGEVLNYRYLWWNEHRHGRDEGRKDRPCAVVYAVRSETAKTRVYVLPITHTKPLAKEDGVEVLPAWKQYLGLDESKSWIITSELNHFEWPGPDLRDGSAGEISRGFLPHKVTTRLRAMIRERALNRNIRAVDRSFDLVKALDGAKGKAAATSEKNENLQRRIDARYKALTEKARTQRSTLSRKLKR